MGYLVSKQSKAQLVNEIKSNSKCVEWSLSGNQLWGLYPVSEQEANDKAKAGDYVIILYLIKSFGDGEFGYKTLDESAHPYYYNCPLKFLKKAVVLDQEWRDEVIKLHKKKSGFSKLRESLSIGDRLNLKNTTIPYVTITGFNGKKVYGSDGVFTYYIPPKMMAL